MTLYGVTVNTPNGWEIRGKQNQNGFAIIANDPLLPERAAFFHPCFSPAGEPGTWLLDTFSAIFSLFQKTERFLITTKKSNVTQNSNV